jgi:Ala-tRNA(Pro) deacylase
MGIPARLIEFLNNGKARYDILHHPEAFTAQELAAIEHVKGRSHAKVVMAKTGTEVFMTVLPADHRIDLDKLTDAIHKPAALAIEADFRELFPDCAVGAMPPFGLLYGLATYLDQSLTSGERLVFEAGTHSDAIRMNFAEYQRLAKPNVADFAVKTN